MINWFCSAFIANFFCEDYNWVFESVKIVDYFFACSKGFKEIFLLLEHVEYGKGYNSFKLYIVWLILFS